MSKLKTEKSRLIGQLFSDKNEGPTVVFFAGIHGNEPSGVVALENVFQALGSKDLPLNGSLYGIRGNIPAILREKRYIDIDLNRIWYGEQIDAIKKKKGDAYSIEEQELVEIQQEINVILKSSSPPFYFVDLHTTSSPTLPFITINDALINRHFSRLFPVPVILGIEEYLKGPLLSYINELGYVSLGFESGQHNTPEAKECAIAFIWLAMVYAGLIDKKDIDYLKLHKLLKQYSQGNNSFYEVIYRHALSKENSFKMYPGMNSFDFLSKGTSIANHDSEEIKAKKDTIIFMPLYQDQGEEGFFLIREIPQWILRLSALLRKFKTDTLLTLLPGITWQQPSKERLKVNLRIARFFSKPFFHLLGYRNQVVDETHLILSNRERVAKKSMYRSAFWYK